MDECECYSCMKSIGSLGKRCFGVVKRNLKAEDSTGRTTQDAFNFICTYMKGPIHNRLDTSMGETEEWKTRMRARNEG